MTVRKSGTLWGALLVVLAALGAGSTASQGQEVAAATEEASQAAGTSGGREVLEPGTGQVFVNIGEVLVQDRQAAQRATDLPGSIDIIGQEQIRLEVTNNALDLMRRIPGFAFHDYGNGGVPNGFMMRGFASNHGSDTLVTVDGIPLNEHIWQEDGAPDLNQITPEEIDWIQVIKGPIDARYGNWARSGIVNIHTRTRGDFFKASISGGDWAYKKAYVTWGSEHFDGKLNQVFSAEYFSTDAWRENSDQERQNAYAKIYYRPIENLQVGGQVHIYRADWSTGAYITEEQWRQNPRQAFSGAQDDGGYKDMTEGSLHLDGYLLPNMPIQARLWYKEFSASRYADWTYDGSGQTESHSNESVLGALANLGYEYNFTDENRLFVEGGFDFRDFDTRYQDWNTDARVRTSLNSDDRYTFQNAGLYLKANWDPIRFARIFGGIRHDLFYGTRTNKLDGSDSEIDDLSVTTYKGGVVGNLTDRYSIYANVATTFELPGWERKYMKGADPRDLLFWETGLKAEPVDWALLRYAYFWCEDDIVDFIDGQWVPQGQAIRQGHEFEMNLMPLEGLTLFTSVTVHTDSKFDGGPYDGKRITIVPDYIWKLGALYQAPWGTGGRIWYNKVGKWYTDGSNDHTYGGYGVLDFTLYQVIAEKWSVNLDIKNLTDEKYAEFVGFWSGSNQYMPSPPRSVYLSLKYGF
jgi:iron complex outermembrane receptor protein